MPAPARAELQQALSDLRLAAEVLKTYDAAVAERLGAAIAKHMATVKAASGLTGETARQHARVVGHMEAIVGCLERVKKYPVMMAGRAACSTGLPALPRCVGCCWRGLRHLLRSRR